MIDHINSQLAGIAGILISVATILGFRKKIFNVYLSVATWFMRPKRIEEMLMKGAEERKELKQEIGQIGEDVRNLKYAVFNDGENGMSHQTAMLSACEAANFEAAPYPSFKYTSGGVTTSVNEAYRILIGAWSQAIIGAGRWQQALHGDLAEDYIAEQERCAEAHEDFIGVCDFKNPMNDKHRGRWRVHATAVQVGARCLYVGRFIAAIDETAREIAMEQGWNVKMR